MAFAVPGTLRGRRGRAPLYGDAPGTAGDMAKRPPRRL